MNREFIMTPAFDRTLKDLGLTDLDLQELQDTLLIDPDAGEVIPQTNGAR